LPSSIEEPAAISDDENGEAKLEETSEVAIELLGVAMDIAL
jgi:hypothetical protein